LALPEGAADQVHERIGIPSKNPIRRTVDLISGSREMDRALMVSLKCDAVRVVGVAIGFDDYSLGRPVEVDENILDQDIDLRERETELTAEGEKVDLQR
jgi:hypothetical protein